MYYEEYEKLNKRNKLNNIYQYKILDIRGTNILCNSNMTYNLIDLLEDIGKGRVSVSNFYKLRTLIDKWERGELQC